MKIISITLLTSALLIGLSISLDTFLGYGIKSTFLDVISPLRVMEPIEWIVLLFYLLLVVIAPIYTYHQKRKQKKA